MPQPLPIVVRAALALLALGPMPATAAAQDRASLRAGPTVPPFATAPADAPARTDTLPRPEPNAAHVAGRLALSAVGWVAGAYGGAVAGYQFRRETSGDFDGLLEGLAGAVLGGIAGSSLLASAPAFSSRCVHGTRFGRALGGATAGAIVGLIGIVGDGAVLATVPLGTVIGAGVGASSGCGVRR